MRSGALLACRRLGTPRLKEEVDIHGDEKEQLTARPYTNTSMRAGLVHQFKGFKGLS
jgi:hypothetical protein